MSVPPATDKGMETARRITRDFASELLAEAGRVAKRSRAEHASAEHVHLAADHIYQGRTYRLQQACIALGGLIAGVAGGQLVNSLVNDGENWIIGVSAAGTVAGTALFVYGLVRR